MQFVRQASYASQGRWRRTSGLGKVTPSSSRSVSSSSALCLAAAGVVGSAVHCNAGHLQI